MKYSHIPTNLCLPYVNVTEYLLLLQMLKKFKFNENKLYWIFGSYNGWKKLNKNNQHSYNYGYWYDLLKDETLLSILSSFKQWNYLSHKWNWYKRTLLEEYIDAVVILYKNGLLTKYNAISKYLSKLRELNNKYHGRNGEWNNEDCMQMSSLMQSIIIQYGNNALIDVILYYSMHLKLK